MENKLIPILVDVLFDNSEIEKLGVLCVIKCFPRRTSGLSFPELVYYYSLAVSEFNFDNNDNSKVRYNVINLYVSFQSRLKKIIIELSSLEHIQVDGRIDLSVDKIKIKLTNNGNELLRNLESKYFINLCNQVDFAKKHFSYSKSMEKQLLERGLIWKKIWR